MPMRVIAERCRALTGATGVVVELIEGDELVPQVTIGTESPRLRLSGSLSGMAVRTGNLQRSDDVPTDLGSVPSLRCAGVYARRHP